MGATITQFGNLSTEHETYPTDANYYSAFGRACQGEVAGSSIFNFRPAARHREEKYDLRLSIGKIAKKACILGIFTLFL